MKLNKQMMKTSWFQFWPFQDNNLIPSWIRLLVGKNLCKLLQMFMKIFPKFFQYTLIIFLTVIVTFCLVMLYKMKYLHLHSRSQGGQCAVDHVKNVMYENNFILNIIRQLLIRLWMTFSATCPNIFVATDIHFCS